MGETPIDKVELRRHETFCAPCRVTFVGDVCLSCSATQRDISGKPNRLCPCTSCNYYLGNTAQSINDAWEEISRQALKVASKPQLEGLGYHITPISKGKVGEISKIREELEELEDAARQGVKLMCLVEAADLIGALEAYLEKHHPSITLKDLENMAKVTKRAFLSGHRVPK